MMLSEGDIEQRLCGSMDGILKQFFFGGNKKPHSPGVGISAPLRQAMGYSSEVFFTAQEAGN